MASFLFVADFPSPPYSGAENELGVEWMSFEAAYTKAQSPSLQRSKISRNAWLFDSENALPDLQALTGLVKTHGLAYRAFLIPGEMIPLHKKA